MGNHVQATLLQIKPCEFTVASLVCCWGVERTYIDRKALSELQPHSNTDVLHSGCPSAPILCSSSGKLLPSYKSCRSPALPSMLPLQLFPSLPIPQNVTRNIKNHWKTYFTFLNERNINEFCKEKNNKGRQERNYLDSRSPDLCINGICDKDLSYRKVLISGWTDP